MNNRDWDFKLKDKNFKGEGIGYLYIPYWWLNIRRKDDPEINDIIDNPFYLVFPDVMTLLLWGNE